MAQKYSEEFKESVLKRMMAPNPVPVMEICRETGVSDVTLYKWRKALLDKGLDVGKKQDSKRKWSSSEKLNIIIETASMTEHELSEYCRSKGLFPEKIEEWKESAFAGRGLSIKEKKAATRARQSDQREIKRLKKKLNRKDKALAETAALLVLSKKWNAILGENEED